MWVCKRRSNGIHGFLIRNLVNREKSKSSQYQESPKNRSPRSIYKCWENLTLSQRPSEANIMNSWSDAILKTLVSGSAMTHRLRCLSPMLLDTAREPCILQAPWQQSTYPPCRVYITYPCQKELIIEQPYHMWYPFLEAKNTYQLLNPLSFALGRSLVIGSECLCSPTSAQNSTTVTHIRYNQVAFSYQSGDTAWTAIDILFHKFRIRFEVTLPNCLFDPWLVSFSHLFHDVLIHILCSKLRSFCSSMSIENSKESLESDDQNQLVIITKQRTLRGVKSVVTITFM